MPGASRQVRMNYAFLFRGFWRQKKGWYCPTRVARRPAIKLSLYIFLAHQPDAGAFSVPPPGALASHVCGLADYVPFGKRRGGLR